MNAIAAAAAVAVATLLSANMSLAAAQKFPARNIQLIVPLAAGSTTDVAARLIAQRAAAMLGTTIVIENKPGGSTMLGSAAVAKAEPDGHTLLMGASSLTVNQNLFKTVPFDTERDFAPVSLVVTAPMVLVVNPAIGVKTFAQFQQKFAGRRWRHDGDIGAGHHARPGDRSVQAQERHECSHHRVSRRRSRAERCHRRACQRDVRDASHQAKYRRRRSQRAGGVRPDRAWRDFPMFRRFPKLVCRCRKSTPAPGSAFWRRPARRATSIDTLNSAFNSALRDPEFNSALLNLGLVPRGTSPEEFSAFIRSEIVRWPPIFSCRWHQARVGILLQ